MTRRRRAAGTVALALAALALVSLFASGPAHARIDTLAWLAGCWGAEGGEPGSGEVWTAPAGGTMLGIGRAVKGGRTVSHEFMQLRLNADGVLVFIATPSGQNETVFTAVAQGEGSVTFENLSHDFPQRVSYSLQPDGRLLARIEGTRAGRARSIDFALRRADCDRPPPLTPGRQNGRRPTCGRRQRAPGHRPRWPQCRPRWAR